MPAQVHPLPVGAVSTLRVPCGRGLALSWAGRPPPPTWFSPWAGATPRDMPTTGINYCRPRPSLVTSGGAPSGAPA
eukprot:614098-Heterocapsa_arctica.AAC.1